MKATKGGNFKPSPQPQPATTFARVYSVVDFGTSEQVYQGQSQGKKRRVFVTLEMPEFKHVFNEEKGPQPYVIGKEMTVSTHENSALAEFVKGMRGYPFSAEEQDGFDVMKMIGKKCLVSFTVVLKAAYAGKQVTQFTNENSRLEITSLSPCPAQIQEFPLENEILAFDFDTQMEAGRFDLAGFAKLPKWQREKIEKSDEFQHFVALGQVQAGQEFNQQQPVQQEIQQPTQQVQQPAQQPPAGNTNAASGW